MVRSVSETPEILSAHVMSLGTKALMNLCRLESIYLSCNPCPLPLPGVLSFLAILCQVDGPSILCQIDGPVLAILLKATRVQLGQGLGLRQPLSLHHQGYLVLRYLTPDFIPMGILLLTGPTATPYRQSSRCVRR